MKLNPDCIRDVMLTLEDRLSIGTQESNGKPEAFFFKSIQVTSLVQIMKEKYGNEDVIYSVVQLDIDGYIVVRKDPSARDWSNLVSLKEILYITPKGHEFIASVSNANSWRDKIKPVLGKLGSLSLSIIEAVSKGMTGAVIDQLMLNGQGTDTP